MNNIAIIFRRSAPVNLFNNILLSAIRNRTFDRALLCSGFFQENNSFSASNELLHNTMCPTRHPATPLDLTCVGVHNNMWISAYDVFISQLRRHGCPRCLSIQKRTAQRWHAKVFIAWESGKAAFGIIGSSNMTRPAFGTTFPFNFEAYVVMWDLTCTNTSGFSKELFDDSEGSFDFLMSTYEPGGKNGPLTISDRLQKLADEILEDSKIVE